VRETSSHESIAEYRRQINEKPAKTLPFLSFSGPARRSIRDTGSALQEQKPRF
jgi:hypothetical protein